MATCSHGIGWLHDRESLRGSITRGGRTVILRRPSVAGAAAILFSPRIVTGRLDTELLNGVRGAGFINARAELTTLRIILSYQRSVISHTFTRLH